MYQIYIYFYIYLCIVCSSYLLLCNLVVWKLSFIIIISHFSGGWWTWQGIPSECPSCRYRQTVAGTGVSSKASSLKCLAIDTGCQPEHVPVPLPSHMSSFTVFQEEASQEEVPGRTCVSSSSQLWKLCILPSTIFFTG